MSAQLFFLPFNTLYTSRGLPAGGGEVYFYYTGTTTKAPVYADAGLTTALANPVPTDGLGVLPAIYMNSAITYRVAPQDNNGAALGPPIDNYIPGTSGTAEAAASAAAAATSASAAASSQSAAATSASAASASATSAAAAAITAVNAVVAQLPKRITKGAATSITSNTTLTADPELAVPIAAGATLVVEGSVDYSTGGSGDFKWSLTGPTATSVQINRAAIAPGDTALSAIGIDAAYSTSTSVLGVTGAGTVTFKANITNGGAAGTVAFVWAQATSDATATIVKPGSFLQYLPVPATTSFAYANTGFAHVGEFDGPVNNAGHNYYTAAVNTSPNYTGNSFVETMVTGSAVAMQVFGGSDYTYSIDGAVATLFTAPGSGWSWYTLYTGQPDTTRRLRVLGPYIESDNMIRVTGAAPAVTRPTDIPPYFTLNTSATIAKEGETSHDVNLGYTVPYYNWGIPCGFGLRFTATTTSVRLWAFDGLSPGRMILLQDGVQIGDVTPVGTLSKFTIITLATGLSGAHAYEVQFISNNPLSNFVHGVLVDSLDMTANPRLPLDLQFGDSITALAQFSSSYDVRQHDAYIVARATSHSAVRKGYSGQRVSTYLRDKISADISTLPQTPARIFMEGGVNDAINSVTLATFQADYQTMLSNARTAAPSAKIYARGILNTTSVSTTVRNNYNARISAAVTALADANIVYINTDGWIDPTTDTGDGLHPNAAGYAKVGAAQLLVL